MFARFEESHNRPAPVERDRFGIDPSGRLRSRSLPRGGSARIRWLQMGSAVFGDHRFQNAWSRVCNEDGGWTFFKKRSGEEAAASRATRRIAQCKRGQEFLAPLWVSVPTNSSPLPPNREGEQVVGMLTQGGTSGDGGPELLPPAPLWATA